jgi:hypothetical protein
VALYKIILTVILLFVMISLAVLSCSRESAPPADPDQIQTAPPRSWWRPAPATLTQTLTSTATATVDPTPTPQPTRTPLPTATATFTLTPVPEPQVNVLIVSCDTGIDIFNRLGEVTNAYVTIQNVGTRGVTDLQVTLSASDEEQTHPDKSYRIGYLPSGYQVSLKLTVDTQSGIDTSIQVEVQGSGGVNELAEKESCRQRRPDRDVLDRLGELFHLQEIERTGP